MEITELGCAGHLIVASRCRWKRHTQVGKYRISSIGNYYLDGERQTVGVPKDSFFETMVFETTGKPDPDNDGCGCKQVKEWTEIDSSRYATAGEAQAGHGAFIEKYNNKGEHDD